MKKDHNDRQAFDYSIAYECLLWQKRIGFIFPFPLSIWPDIRYVKVFIFSLFLVKSEIVYERHPNFGSTTFLKL